MGKVKDTDDKFNFTLEIIEENIERMRKYRNMTEHELCEKCGVADSFFQRKRNDFFLSTILKIASVLDVEPQKLWDEGFSRQLSRMMVEAEIDRLNRVLDSMDNGEVII